MACYITCVGVNTTPGDTLIAPYETWTTSSNVNNKNASPSIQANKNFFKFSYKIIRI